MKRILEIMKRITEGDKKALGDLIGVVVTGSSEEREFAVALMKLHKDAASKSVNAFVKHFLSVTPKSAEAFVDACQMFGLSAESCGELLKLKGINTDDFIEENDDAEEVQDFLKDLKSLVEKFNKD